MVTRRRALHVGGLALAALAGCLGSPDESTRPTATEPSESTDTATPTATDADTPTATTAGSADPPPAAVVAYADLTATQREAVDRAREETVRFSTGVPGLEKEIHYGLSPYVPFREHSYVRKDGTLYRLSTWRSGFIRGVHVSVEPVDEADAEDVVALGNRTDEGAALVREAIETDGDAARIVVEMPADLSTGTVVRYEGESYRLSVHTADYEYFELTVEPVA